MAKKGTKKGFQCRCPVCGESDTLKIRVDDVHSLSCESCDNEITADDIWKVIRQWRFFLGWLDSAPPYGFEPGPDPDAAAEATSEEL